ncbi:PAS domain-containing hybrid sensor histidine kinase/response regulator [Gallaecimonas kandeliae]|uniref:PAS domain-containing hybrid sensor histidine kinase/response regulator n=1 Tax=Gallaecimonas kandeliae TaxID=3029055 RepID=UPI002649F236|nr:PAS domain-containing hybrid sensor histidine kinase/response regulator [Gallaecimonas kandeliae]WKE67309.1 PAS domain-containing hybrid sensor histidine kinase/response regulator [Gallaecimonas kandeliae]
MPVWLMGLCALGYVLALFAVAYWGDRHSSGFGPTGRKVIYALSLAVYCSSWSFLGTVGQAHRSLWSFLPVYLGPLALFALGYPLLKKLVRTSQDQSITSIADLLAARYGKSQLLAVTVTLIAIVASLPYIALQLKAMVMGFKLLARSWPLPDLVIAGVVAVALVLFTSLFGTRKLDATEHHPGLMLAMAFESVVKLVALVLVALVVVYSSFDGFGDLLTQVLVTHSVGTDQDSSLPAVLSQSLVGAGAFLCLPRLFHVMVVENQEPRDLKTARWLFSLYLVLMALPVLPLTFAGSLVAFPGQSPDGYVISLPLVQGHPWVAALALLGAISASTSMVVVAAVTIAIMVSNEMVVPLMLKTGQMAGRNFEGFSRLLLRLRRFIILLLMTLGFVTYWLLGQQEGLAGFGLFAFGAFAQLAPALVGGLYWSQGHRKGVFLGLIAGFGSWWALSGLWLSSYVIVLSLVINAMVYVLSSMALRAGVRDRLQAAAFVSHAASPGGRHQGHLSVQDLRLLVSRFVGPERAERMLDRYCRDSGIIISAMPRLSPDELLSEAERLMASVIGASSAALVLRSALEGRDIGLDDVVTLVDEATEQLHFSRELLQGAIEHASEGMSVVDRDLHLVAWNRRYLELFDYPPGFIYAGRSVADLIRFNAERGWCGPGDMEEHVARRVNFMKEGSPHSSERSRPDGRVIKLQGNPMPGGGFVMTFSDITPYRQAEKILKEANEALEDRVEERTRELQAAKAAADKANQGKSRFLAACGHDLMQPLNAARLFVSALSQRVETGTEQAMLLDNTKSSLKAAGELLTDLLDISKLDAGTMKVRRLHFPMREVLDNLANEFKALADEQQIEFRWVGSSAIVDSDKMLLRRIVQNFLTNAFRYARGGKVLLGTRRQGQDLCIEVWDNGPGIAQEHLASIFEEFKRFDKGEKGLGLGLAIADRMSRILGHSLAVRSWEGRGSMFSVRVPRSRSASPEVQPVMTVNGRALSGRHVLCIDNEEAILQAMRSLLGGWNMRVSTARSRSEAQEVLAGEEVDMVLADYHLDGGDDGLSVMQALRERQGGHLPGILITADTRQELISETQQAGFGYMAKMVKPAALRAMMDQALGRGSARR